MRKRSVIIPLAVGVAGALSYALPASAASSGSTPVTIAVTSGTLDVSVPAGPVSIGSVAVSASPQTISGQLGTVTVTDNRGGTAGWTASAGGVDFTGPQNISVSAAGSSTYVPGNATVTGTATVTPTSLDTLYPPAPVEVASGVSGINSAAWNPAISVTVPANVLAGTYSSTITHSVA